MQLRHTVSFFKKAGKLPDHVLREWIYRRDDNEGVVDTDDLDEEHIGYIYNYAKKFPDDPAAKMIVKRIDSYRTLLADPGGAPVGRLDRLATAMIEYLRPAPHKFIFIEQQDGQMCPYYVSDISYKPPHRDDPASVTLKGLASSLDEEDNHHKTWYTADLCGRKTVPQILREAGIHRETADAYAAYIKEVARFNGIVDQLGKQYSGTGEAFNRGGRYNYGMIAMERDGVKARLVIDRKGDDTEKSEKELRRAASAQFWSKGSARNVEDSEEEDVLPIPVHPYVQAFDLGLHQYVGIHVNQIEPYKYDHEIATKLVLPEKTKQLVNVLMESSAEIMEDIIAGKTGGTVVIATGEPGTGKTLTAECYSEQIERPLYSVQCSQLGTDEEELEKKLMLTLSRASRWGAILLIDEADVYVRERGNDIQQNAIVGVFLRLLERYRGILFLTSNRATTIDDAVISRAIAHVRYTLPTPEELKKLWQVLSTNYKVKLDAKQLARLVKELPTLSGRNVKNILKLASIMANKTKKAVDVDDLLYVTKFIDLAKAPD
jgi:hypothetical protein